MSKLRPREMGTATWIDPGSDKPLKEVGTLQCVHCGGQWIPAPGSGRLRGWCQNCAGPVCGAGCAECIPTDLLLTNMEKGRPLNYKVVAVSVPAFQGE